MRIIIFIFLFLLLSVSQFILGQTSGEQDAPYLPKHYISVNPLNILLFQQAGVTYEYKPGVMGFGVTTGYIYPNNKTYSNYFIAGPTSYGSLGNYSGVFVVPQVNVYLTKPKNSKHGSLIYLSVKMVYKYMHIDSTGHTAWYHEGNGYYIYRKMIDKVNIYGGFVDFGYRYVLYHFFFDINLGLGTTWINHKMTIGGEHIGLSPDPIHYINPPRQEELHQNPVTINFTLNFGVAL
ncbi:MAG: hypothetical protein M0Q38_12785 [Bacteroidales bacterium]|jgi:hypothetical protein|nr:hypothetical protein [Bacteroidales bacterium]